jgi:hypothetical protein
LMILHVHMHIPDRRMIRRHAVTANFMGTGETPWRL